MGGDKLRIYLNYREVVEDPGKVLNDASAFVSKIYKSAKIKGGVCVSAVKNRKFGGFSGCVYLGCRIAPKDIFSSWENGVVRVVGD
jgi:hypothetical protein